MKSTNSGPSFVKILFLHPNFPGQFKNIAGHLGNLKHSVKFLCQTHYNRSIKNVERICLKGELGHEELYRNAKDENSRSTMRSAQYLRGMREIQKSGWNPDIVISHSGWGCGLYPKLVWPSTRQISYLEWWFKEDSDLFNYTPNNRYLGVKKSKAEKYFLRNQLISLELVTADAIVAPTQWQKSQLPQSLQNRVNIIHDGIDCEYYKNLDVKQTLSPQPLLTYGTRGMEPMRCFPEFINELPNILKKHQNLRVEIAGEDSINYGGIPPSKGISWGQYASRLLNPWIEEKRVLFLGRLNQKKYKQWLSRSWLHVYLSQPFVASWSLLEAMSMSANLIVNNVATNTEFCNVRNSSFVQKINPGFLEGAVAAALEQNKDTLERRNQARTTAELYSHNKTNKTWLTVLHRLLST